MHESEWIHVDAEAARELFPLLDEAIHALPTKYRVPIVLCYLQGLTNAEVAEQIACPLGTIATRLARARDQLRRRLTRLGVVVSTATVSIALSQACSAPLPTESLLEITTGQISGIVKASVSQLATRIGRSLMFAKCG